MRNSRRLLSLIIQPIITITFLHLDNLIYLLVIQFQGFLFLFILIRLWLMIGCLIDYNFHYCLIL